MILEEQSKQEKIAAEQENDPNLALLRYAIKENNANVQGLEEFRPSFRTLKIIENAIYQVKRDGRRLIVVPEKFKKIVLEQIHNSSLASHFGVNKCYAALKTRFFWPKMHNDLKFFIDSCAECAKWKRPCKNSSVKLQPVDYENRIGCQISIDFKGPLPETKITDLYPVKSRFVLLIVDNASKYVMGIPTANMTAEATAEAIITKWVPLFGLCDNIICDNGSGFKSKLFQNICNRLQIHMNNSTPYNPRSNGLVEVNNKLLGTMLFSMVGDKTNEWNQYLDFVISGYNSSVHTTTRYSPNFLVFGRELIQPVDMIFGTENGFCKTKGWNSWDEQMKERVEVRDKALFQAYHHNRAAQEKNSLKSEATAYAKTLKVGDRCAVSLPRIKKKHRPPWDTDYVIIDIITPTTYLIKNVINGNMVTLSRRFLKPVIERENPDSIRRAALPDEDAEREETSSNKQQQQEIHTSEHTRSLTPLSTSKQTKEKDASFNQQVNSEHTNDQRDISSAPSVNQSKCVITSQRRGKQKAKSKVKEELAKPEKSQTDEPAGKQRLRDREALRKPDRLGIYEEARSKVEKKKQ